jgi:co-chaperonin GroES (HSP10)
MQAGTHGAPTGAVAQRLPIRLIKGFQADYIPSEWPGENTSGLRVFGKHVLICVDVCAPATRGSILHTDEMVDRMTEASETGCIYAIGSAAFRHYDDGTRWGDAEKPRVGERVYFERYAGVKAMGMDGNVYRIVDYGAIAAGLSGPGESA